MLDEEVSCCETIYANQIKYKCEKGYLFTDRSFPAITGALRWLKQLASRVTAPVNNFKVLQHPITESEAAEKLYERYEVLMKSLGMFEETIFMEWVAKVPQQIENNLKKSLIDRQPGSNLLVLNFSPQLFAILREVHYLGLMEKDGVPAEGIAFAEKNDLYRSFTLNLEKTIDWYNGVSMILIDANNLLAIMPILI